MRIYIGIYDKFELKKDSIYFNNLYVYQNELNSIDKSKILLKLMFSPKEAVIIKIKDSYLDKLLFLIILFKSNKIKNGVHGEYFKEDNYFNREFYHVKGNIDTIIKETYKIMLKGG